jgi:hypothetical protein
MEYFRAQVWEERRTGFPADIPTLRAADEAEREMLTAAGLDPSESDSPVEYFLSCQMTVSKRKLARRMCAWRSVLPLSLRTVPPFHSF